jgi:hypothetical protein
MMSESLEEWDVGAFEPGRGHRYDDAVINRCHVMSAVFQRRRTRNITRATPLRGTLARYRNRIVEGWGEARGIERPGADPVSVRS